MKTLGNSKVLFTRKHVSHLCQTVLHSILYLKQCNGLSDYLPLRAIPTWERDVWIRLTLLRYSTK